MIRLFKAAALVALTALAFDPSGAAVVAKPKTSKLDRSFSSKGMLRIPAPSARKSESLDCFDDSRGNLLALTRVSLKRRAAIDQLTKLTPSGRAARSFGRNGRVRLTRIEQVHPLSDGGFLLLRTPVVKRAREYVVTRLTSTGKIEKRFASSGSLRTGIAVRNSRNGSISTLAGGRFAWILNARDGDNHLPTQVRIFDSSGQPIPELNASVLVQSGRLIKSIHDAPESGFLSESAALKDGRSGDSELMAYTGAGLLNTDWGNQGKAVTTPPEALVTAARRYADWDSSTALDFKLDQVVGVLSDGSILAQGWFGEAGSTEYELAATLFRLDPRGNWDPTFGTGGGRLLWFESESDADGQFAGEDRSVVIGQKNELLRIASSWTESPSASLTVTQFVSNGKSVRSLLNGASIRNADLRAVVPSPSRKRVYICADSGKHAYVAALRSR